MVTTTIRHNLQITQNTALRIATGCTTYNNTDIDSNPNTIDTAKIKATMVTNSHHYSQHIPQQPTTQQSHKHIPLTIHHSESKMSYPVPTQNKQMFLITLKSEPHTTIHLFNCTKINTQLMVTDLWTAPVDVSNLLVEWRGQQATSGPGCQLDVRCVRGDGCWTPSTIISGRVGPTITTAANKHYRPEGDAH